MIDMIPEVVEQRSNPYYLLGTEEKCTKAGGNWDAGNQTKY